RGTRKERDQGPRQRTPGRQDPNLAHPGPGGGPATRLRLPGLGGLVATSSMDDLFLVGSGRNEESDQGWQETVARAFADGDASGPAVDTVVRNARYMVADATDGDDLRRLLDHCRGRITLYFALPPGVMVESCRALARIGVPQDTRLVLEKPFGTDRASAVALNELLHQLVPEERVHRVDHFLGM